MVIFIEGGSAENGKINADFRRAWSKFFQNAGITNVPKIVISGSKMIVKFSRDRRKDKVLLLDSEESIPADRENEKMKVFDKFLFNIKKRSDWCDDENIYDEQIHFMVACMESWFMADMETLQKYYGKFFAGEHFNWDDVEIIARNKIMDALKKATKNTKKGTYHKTKHAPEILQNLNSNVVCSKAFFCERLFEYLEMTSAK